MSSQSFHFSCRHAAASCMPWKNDPQFDIGKSGSLAAIFKRVSIAQDALFCILLVSSTRSLLSRGNRSGVSKAWAHLVVVVVTDDHFFFTSLTHTLSPTRSFARSQLAPSIFEMNASKGENETPIFVQLVRFPAFALLWKT